MVEQPKGADVCVLPTRVGMVRGRGFTSWDAMSSPHARGDGPRVASLRCNGVRFSPRAWGWSVMAFKLRHFCEVLPTRVGMVRCVKRFLDETKGSPHARGDGPCLRVEFDKCSQFSPRAWGWSAKHSRILDGHAVLPTRVGMVRFAVAHNCFPHGSPHARGDGPIGAAGGAFSGLFSPRAWGWSASLCSALATAAVLPTRVGMVRRGQTPMRHGTRSPHARGDGPFPHTHAIPPPTFSPRAWGWSVLGSNYCWRFWVLPTRVGMVRTKKKMTTIVTGSPHARGDGPSGASRHRSFGRFSPRAWGWSVRSLMNVWLRSVLPTRVGMVRCASLAVTKRRSSPHARGDGPALCAPRQTTSRFSPRAWGWSGIG